MKQPLISICIPAYKRISFLKRLLDSVSEQSFHDFEVVITDDSPDKQVESCIRDYTDKFQIIYHKNLHPLGSPANWNKAIALARGTWIKIMHDDDWFASENSLLRFAEAAKKNQSSFFFSGYQNFYLENGTHSCFVISLLDEFLLRRNPLYLFRTNYIGHPSTTLIRNDRSSWFDEHIKWVGDFEFYIRLLKQDKNFVAIKEPLVNIGIGDDQITKIAFRNPEIEIPENIYILNLLGSDALGNIFVYDYFWRLCRNLRITHEKQMHQYITDTKVVDLLKKMIQLQRIFGQNAMVHSGLYSKTIMFLGYLCRFFKNLLSFS
ncbi:MAG: glycosyltransferase family 2 protein [Bacteroidota bacterium]